MSRTFKGKEVIKALKKIGYKKVRQTGDHYIMQKNSPKITIPVPFHSELKKGTLNNILKKVGLTIDELKKLI
jgi:predicted RNA binding protein YcfA (HicA-like mRNA interferase family)